jgi:hypothetical protein
MTEDPSDTRLDEVDADVLSSLRALHARLDPVPAGLTDDVKFALTVQALHAEVAELSRVAADEALVRSVDYTPAETLTFTGGPFTAMVTTVPAGPESVRVDGWVTGGPVGVELRGREGSTTVEVEDEGRFVFEDVPRGAVQFILHPRSGGADARPVITPSVTL